MNRVCLIGRLTKDVEVRYTNTQKPVARYTIAVDRGGKPQDGQPSADFLNVIAFDKGAQFAENYLHRGMKIGIEGRIQTGSYVNKDGQKVFTFDIVADKQEFCEAKQESTPQGESYAQKAQNQARNAFMDVPEDLSGEGLPFE